MADQSAKCTHTDIDNGSKSAPPSFIQRAQRMNIKRPELHPSHMHHKLNGTRCMSEYIWAENRSHCKLYLLMISLVWT